MVVDERNHPDGQQSVGADARHAVGPATDVAVEIGPHAVAAVVDGAFCQRSGQNFRGNTGEIRRAHGRRTDCGPEHQMAIQYDVWMFGLVCVLVGCSVAD